MEEGEKPKIKSGLKSAVSFTIDISSISHFSLLWKKFDATSLQRQRILFVRKESKNLSNLLYFRRSRRVNRSNLSLASRNRIAKLPLRGTGKYIILNGYLYVLPAQSFKLIGPFPLLQRFHGSQILQGHHDIFQWYRHETDNHVCLHFVLGNIQSSCQ